MSKRILALLLLLGLSTLGLAQSVHAATSSSTTDNPSSKCIKGDPRCQGRFYNDNSILMYNPIDTIGDACSVAGGNSGTIGTVSDLKKSPKLEHIFQTLINGGMNAVQAAAVMGNMYTESHNLKTGERFDSSVTEVGNNHAGYGLAQWSYDRRVSLEKYAQQQGTAVSDMDMQLRFLFIEYHGGFEAKLKDTAFGKGNIVKDATKSWMVTFEKPAMYPANDPALLNSERIKAANTLYGFYSSLTPNASTSALQPDCGSGDGTNTGDVVKTALALAWPQSKNIQDGDNQSSDATSEYRIAKAKYAPGGLISDCGAFVATVMRMSGVDPDFPQLHVAEQDKYVHEHPEKYKIIQNASVSDLQPGDLLIQNDDAHIVISQGANQPNIDASNFYRVPSVRPNGSDVYVINSQGPPKGAFIARFIGVKKNA